MKRIILAIVLTLVASFAAVAQHNPDAEPLDFKVKGVGHNATYASALKLLGKPKKQIDRKQPIDDCFAKPTLFRTMTYDGMQISLMGDSRGRGMKVYEILITSAKWNFNGVAIGAGEADVAAKLGKPYNRADLDYEVVFEYQVEDADPFVSFHFKDKKLYKILMAESLC